MNEQRLEACNIEVAIIEILRYFGDKPLVDIPIQFKDIWGKYLTADKNWPITHK